MKRLILLITLILLVLLLSVTNVSCDGQSQYVGIYYGVAGEYTSSSWLGLYSDGMFQPILGMSGYWQVKGNQLTLSHAFGYDTYIIEGGKIMDQRGNVLYIKG